MKLYKIFEGVHLSSASSYNEFTFLLCCPSLPHVSGSNVSRVGTKTQAEISLSGNKAERAAVSEMLEARVASMGKSAVEKPAPKKTNKRKQD